MEEINYLHDSKLIKLLKASDRKEQKRFEEYINCSFFNKNKEVIALWAFIRKRLPNFEKLPTKKELLKVLYGEECTSIKKWSPKEDTQLRVLMNRLTSLFSNFLVYERRETEEVRNQRLLADILMERKLYKMIPPVLKTANKLLAKKEYRDSAYHFDEYLIREAEFFIGVINQNKSPNSISNRVIDSFTNYALSNLMLYHTSYANSLKILNISDDIPRIDKLLEYIEDNQEGVSKIALIHYHTYMMVTDTEADKHYNRLKDILTEFRQYLPIYIIRFICGPIINFCTGKIRKGDEKFLLELDEIYQESIPLGVWDMDIAFSPLHYIKHTRNMLHLQKHQEASEFLDKYQSKLQARYIPDIPNLGYAFYYFHLKEYDAAQNYLNQVIYREDFVYKFYCKSLLIQIFYEKKEWQVIDSALEALRFYLLPTRTKEISEHKRTQLTSFLKICKKILRQRNNAEYNQASLNILEKIKKEIIEAESLSERAWLLEKTEELITETT